MAPHRRSCRCHAATLVALGVALALGLAGGCVASSRLDSERYPADAPPFRREVPAASAAAPNGPFAHRLILAGDAGTRPPHAATLAALEAWSREDPGATTVVYLGDNLYPAGLVDEDRAGGEAVLEQLARAGPARKVFLPGNHDWGFRGTRALRPGVLAEQERFLLSLGEGVGFEPRDGCPGPVAIPLAKARPGLPGGLVLVALDFHWWLLPERRRPVCDGVADTEAFLDALRGELERWRDANVVVAAHHPLRSGGPHGGLTRGFWKDLGAKLLHLLYRTIQDVVEPDYAEMVALVEEVLAEHRPIAFVAGHDHSLQVLHGDEPPRLHVVSGAASRTSDVTALDATLFAHAHLGFVVLDLHPSRGGGAGVVALSVVETGRDDPVWRASLDVSELKGATSAARAASQEAAPRAL